MIYKLKTTLLLINLMLITLIEMNGQEVHTITIEDQILISPSKFSLRINCISPNILTKQWMEGEEYISKDSVLKILNKIEHVNILETPNNSNSKSTHEYLDVLYVETIGIKSFKEVREKLHLRAIVIVEEYHVDSFKQHETRLIHKIIEDAKLTVSNQISKNGKELIKTLNYKEIEEMNKNTASRDEEASQSGFGLLKEKFIEENYQGHLINESGQIILKKKLQIDFEIN